MSTMHERLIEVGAGVLVPADLTIPDDPRGIVAFAHGSGSSRLSPRNRQVAQALNTDGFATLLFDLLTPEEELDRANVFDIPLLGRRLAAATGWLRHQAGTSELPLGYFGASTGAAAALIAAADLGAVISAVVSRGGRPDLAAARLSEVRAPTLLVVGGLDPRCSSSTARRSANCAASMSSKSWSAPPICSRSPASSRPSPGWRATGSRATSRNPSTGARRQPLATLP